MSFFIKVHSPKQIGGFFNLCAADFAVPGTAFRMAHQKHMADIKFKASKSQMTKFTARKPSHYKTNPWSKNHKFCFLAAGAVLAGMFFGRK